MTFRSPAERKLFERLPENEAAFVEELMETFDAHLIEPLSLDEVLPLPGTENV